MIDLKNNISVAQSLAPQTINASAAGSGVELTGFNQAVMEVQLGTISGSATATIVLQDSPDNSTFTDVGTDEYQGTNPLVINSANDAGAHLVGYLGTKQYVRGKVESVTNTPAIPTSISIIRSGAIKQPA